MDEIGNMVIDHLKKPVNRYTRTYVDRVKQKLQIESDYSLAKHLRVSKSTVSNYQKGLTAFSDQVCERVAEILEENPAMVVALVELDRHSTASAKELETRTFIARAVQAYTQRGAVHSALFAMLVVLGFITTPPSAHAVVTDVSTSNQSVYYVNKLIAAFRAIRRFLRYSRPGTLTGQQQFGSFDVSRAWSVAPAVAFA